jgi:hypothetical protein
LPRSAYVRIIRKGAGEKSRPKEKKCGTVWRSQAVGRKTESANKEGDTMNNQALIPLYYLHALQELHGKKTKRTHFALDSSLWSLVFFTKRTHFTGFSAQKQALPKMYTCIPVYLHTCFYKTNPFGIEHWRPIYLSILNSQLSIVNFAAPRRQNEPILATVSIYNRKWKILSTIPPATMAVKPPTQDWLNFQHNR